MGELSADLHQATQAYIDCIAIKSEGACVEKRARVFLVKYTSLFEKHKVSPMAVLGRCRENYNAKTWDEGVFGLFNADLKFEILRTDMLSLSRIQELRTQVDTYLNEGVNGVIRACLAAGPLKNRIQACMQLTFAHHNRLQQIRFAQERSDALLLRDFSTAGYFTYDIAAPEQNPDACEYLSSPSFLSNPDVQKCRKEDPSLDNVQANACGFSMIHPEDTLLSIFLLRPVKVLRPLRSSLVLQEVSHQMSCIYNLQIIYIIFKKFFFLFCFVCMLCQSKFLIIPNSQGPETLN